MYLHFGTHKTGSTSIQNFLIKNRSQLFKDDIFYPTFRINHNDKSVYSGLKHHQFGWYLSGNKSFSFEKRDIDIFVKSINDSKKSVIVSTEVLMESFNNNNLDKLRKYFPKKNIKPIVYLRRQDLFKESWYSELVTNSNEKRNINDHDFYNLKYSELLDRLSDLFGRNNLIVRIFDFDKFIDRNLYYDFLTTISLKKFENYDFPLDSNIKIPSECIKQLKILNNFFCKSPEYKELKKTIIRNSRRYATLYDNSNLLSYDNKKRILDELKDDNNYISEKYFNNEKIFNDVLMDSSEDSVFDDIKEISTESILLTLFPIILDLTKKINDINCKEIR